MNVVLIRRVIGLSTVIVGLVALALGLSRDEPGYLLPMPVEVAIGWSFVGAGLVGWSRRPANRTGVLLVLAGLVWFARQFDWLDTPPASHLSHVALNLFLAVVGHLLIVFPDGTPRTRTERWLIAAVYATAVGGYVASRLFFDPSAEGCVGCPRNLLLILANHQLNVVATVGAGALGVVIVAAVVVVVANRWRTASPPGRRVLAPVVSVGLVALAVLAATIVLYTVGVSGDVDRALTWSTIVYTGIPIGFLVGLLRTHLHLAALGGLLVELGTARQPAEVRAALARALGDPTLEVAYWLPDLGRYVDLDGHPVDLPSDPDRAVTTLEDGERIAALVYDRALLEDAALVEAAAAAARLALENARLQAELLAQLAEVRASRSRIVEAGDAERRRLERDLHDGAQQRLLGIRLALRLARGEIAQGAGAVEALLREAEGELAETLDELRALARGIHPAVLTDEGLARALELLARRSTVAVRIESLPTERLPQPVESAAYFLVSESLANVAKHASATEVRISIVHSGASLVVDLADDGIGGAAANPGGGLVGLKDRVEALGGTLRIDSPAGAGTRIHAELPVDEPSTSGTARRRAESRQAEP